MAYDDDYEDRDYDEDEDGEDSTETQVWQLLLLINPGDEDGAEVQFKAYQELTEEEGDEDPVRLVAQVTDWRSGFEVDADDTRALVEVINELVARWNLVLDWDGDPADDEFHEDIDGVEIFSRAFDRLREHGYTLWAREAEDDDVYAGWITRSDDDEAMRLIATQLGINLRLGSQVG
ncbi:hypothetical protein IM816_06195 [Luteibacter flocculans]|uniref:DUF6630 domain-containing protein n=1 Tax=Luteibacter flocculans TaxID=2780091 RepID=A0ABY4T6H1_9GAMM|nr:hypothetical protein [Luteibacter flocculans]URL59682.1 hypothetical protein IM816_06195 [Luteibacter flocculans]